MTPSVSDIWLALAEWAPAALAESWDNVGLQAGDPSTPVKRLLISLDATEPVLEAAISNDVQMVVTHHPLLFQPVRSFDLTQQLPRLLAGFLRSGIALYAAHTNLDSTISGVSDILASFLGLQNTKPLLPSKEDPSYGLGRVGILSSVKPLSWVIATLASFLNVPALMVVGDGDRPIEHVAICGGSGSDLWPAVVKAEADLYISGEIKHHIAVEARQLEIAIIDAGHFYTEWPIVVAIKDYLEKEAVKRGWELEIDFFKDERSPFDTWIAKDIKGSGLIHGDRPDSDYIKKIRKVRIEH